MNNTKKLVITAMLVAVGVVLPIMLHSIPNVGSILLPMHIPVMICGFVCGPLFGAVAGLITPILSTVITGMPPVMPVLPAMIVELLAYGALCGLFVRIIRTPSLLLNICVSLAVAMIAGRALMGVMYGLILLPGKYNFAAWVSASFVVALPGIVSQFLIIPTIVYSLKRASLIDFYARGKKEQNETDQSGNI